MSSDEELMKETGRGSRTAFETLFHRYREPIWGFFRRRASDAGRAEELAQDTFLALLEGASRYHGRGSFRSYLFGIAYNVLLADRRNSTRRLTEELADPAGIFADPDAGLWVREAMSRLGPVEREVLMLREFEQLSYEEIAQVRNTPLNTVRSQLFRARMALKSALETRTPEPARSRHAGR